MRSCCLYSLYLSISLSVSLYLVAFVCFYFGWGSTYISVKTTSSVTFSWIFYIICSKATCVGMCLVLILYWIYLSGQPSCRFKFKSCCRLLFVTHVSISGLTNRELCGWTVEQFQVSPAEFIKLYSEIKSPISQLNICWR